MEWNDGDDEVMHVRVIVVGVNSRNSPALHHSPFRSQHPFFNEG